MRRLDDAHRTLSGEGVGCTGHQNMRNRCPQGKELQGCGLPTALTMLIGVADFGRWMPVEAVPSELHGSVRWDASSAFCYAVAAFVSQSRGCAALLSPCY